MDLTALTWVETYIKEPIKELETIDTGWDHEVYVVNGNWVLRIPKEERLVNRAEQKLLSELQLKADIRLPAYRICKATNGNLVMIYRYIPGSPIHRNLPAEALKEAAIQLGSFLTTLHHVDASRYELPKRDKGYYDLLLEKVRNFYPDMPASIIHHTERLFSTLQTERMAVVHGDLRTAHILWEQAAAEIGVIDFSDAHIGDPAIDFAGISQVSNAFMEQVLLHYEGDKEGISLRADQLCKLGLYYDLLQNGTSNALLEELERKLQ
ncbi:aminoglycoside phosphotransferase family protein [Terribacillus sp. 179-K 1B1 HS]|uniref:phosphotransferase family protein n=1 Tax=Terribacillus sp. 179-K 1B1 HS TaxID=3142388 RepID=UPI0039A34B93